MALKESCIGDQFSKELQLMHNLKFMQFWCLTEYLLSYFAQYGV